MGAKYHRIYISRTQREWNIIDQKLIQLGKATLTHYLRSKIILLERDFINSPDSICSSIGPKIQKQQYLSPEQFEILNKISMATEIPESAIVNKLIIEPLLILP